VAISSAVIPESYSLTELSGNEIFIICFFYEVQR